MESFEGFKFFFQDLVSHWFSLACGTLSFYVVSVLVYNAFFHPLAKYPGPRLASISNLWYAYQWITGKYPMAIARVMKEYGDVVRIAPNELVFITPKAASDIYASQARGLELFPKADFISLGWSDQGVTWETDPAKHKQKAKRLLPAFNLRTLKAKEGSIHHYTDFFVKRMKDKRGESIELRKWADWLAMDMAADLGYSRKMQQLEKMAPSLYLQSIWAANFYVTMHTISKKFPMLSWLQYFSVSPSAVKSYVGAIGANQEAFAKRIEMRGKTDHPDHFDQLLSADAPVPQKHELESLETICLHLLLAGYEPISSSFLCAIIFLLQNPESHQRLVVEIRERFQAYDEITADSLISLDFLNATIMEQLRVAVVGATGQPRVSPGAAVDNHYLPKGVEVQYANYAFTRDSRYFHDPYKFRPQRWLPRDHPYWEPTYENDRREDFHPWGLGIRGCPGMTLSWQQIRIILAKVLWSFDVKSCPGQQHIDYEQDFKLYGMLEKPDFWVRFDPVERP